MAEQFAAVEAGEPVDHRLLDGSAMAARNPTVLQAGPLTLLLDGCGLRYVRLGDRELVRRVYFAVRDANWGTVPDQVGPMRADVRPDSFQVEFDVVNRQGEIDFAWHGTITGSADGRVVFEANGVAKSAFRRNRIGFCVLHPLACAGMPVEIRHDDGTIRRTEFPRYIAAENPFLDVVGMRHGAAPGVDVELTFEGDLFETEDQRNWIDASYKTFCTPLSKPFPVEVAAGERVFQKLTIELKGKVQPASAAPSKSSGVTLELAAKAIGKLPKLGFVIPADGESHGRQQIERLRVLKPAHLRCEVRLDQNVETQLAQAAELLRELDAGTELELVIFASPQHEREMGELATHIARQKLPIARWIVFPKAGWNTTRDLAEAARRAIHQHHPAAQIGGGTPANFRELNVARPPAGALDFITWSLNPQVHATDNASIVETLAAHDATVESARQFSGGLPLVVGPVAFKMQVNPYATGAWPPRHEGELPVQVDVRQLSLFAAGWTIGSVKHLAECGVSAATYYETVGWKGLMERESGSPLPEKFPSVPGGVFPLYHVFADLAEVAGGRVIPVRSSNPLSVDALAVSHGGQTRILIANFVNELTTATLPITAPSAIARFLDERNVRAAMNSPAEYRRESESINGANGVLTVELLPYAVARVDFNQPV